MYTSEGQANGETLLSLEMMDLEAKSLASTSPTYETILNYFKTSKALKDYALGAGAVPCLVMEISLSNWPMSLEELERKTSDSQ